MPLVRSLRLPPRIPASQRHALAMCVVEAVANLLQPYLALTTGSFNDSYKVLQASSSSAAADAVQKLAQRFAAGSGELAEIVRKDQDLAVGAAGLDKALVAAVSKAPKERNPAAEQEMRKRFAGISTERKKLSDVLAEQFPDYIASA